MEMTGLHANKLTWWELKQHSLDFHQKYYPGQKVFENGLPPDGRNVSWEAFTQYVGKGYDKISNEFQNVKAFSATFVHEYHLSLGKLRILVIRR